jgi:Icc-related predicted phosphoesterase
VADWFFTSDLHGQSDLYEQVVGHAASSRPGAVLIGGDLCPHAAGSAGVRYQRVFLEGFLVEFARRLREACPGLALLLLMGNDDWRANEDVLARHDGDLWHCLHGRTVDVGGVRVAGASWVPITPFLIKDWERWEDGEAETPPRLDGWTSDGGVVAERHFDPTRREPTIAGALGALAAESDPRDTVYVLHSPPRDTHCDCTYRRTHVGSRAIRAFVESRQPRLVLSGHIHESPRVTGHWRDRLGETPVVNPGQFGTAGVCGVWFDPRRPHDTLRHTIHASG